MPYNNNGVLIGNWSEERLKNEFEFMLFLRKRDRRELLLQRSRDLFSNLLKEREMKISGNFVVLGFNVQVIATDMPPQPLPGKKKGLALSSLVTARQVDYIQNISDGCLMTLSPILTPCARNTFQILSAEGHPEGKKLNYGDEFYLKAENYGDPEAPPLYVRYTREGLPAPKDVMPLHLSQSMDTNCRFVANPMHRRDKLELMGNPIKTTDKLILKNCVADLSLCVMNQHWMKTFFGAECGITCRDLIDIHKDPCAENVFILSSDVEKKEQGGR